MALRTQGLWSRSTRAEDPATEGHAAVWTHPYTGFTRSKSLQARSNRLDRGYFKEKAVVNKEIRWRIISLQAMLVVILAASSGFLFYEGSFVTGMVHDQLVAQKISFPGTDQVKAGGALDPAKFPAEITQYAGQQVDNGEKARVYAQDFIGEHLKGIAAGKTYSEVSGAASALSAQIAATPTTDPNYATLQAQLATLNGQKATLFQGEMLRGTLLNSWGWWTLGVYTAYAAVGLLIAALGVLAALVYELFVAGRKPETLKVAQKTAA
jgi:hypothetical protein